MPDPSPGSADVARSYLAAFDTADPDTIADHVAPGFVNDQVAALGTGCEGRDAYRHRLPDFLESMVGLHYTVDELIADDRSVAVFYTMTARWMGQHDFVVRGAQHLLVEDGLITRRTDYWDSATFREQVGLDS